MKDGGWSRAEMWKVNLRGACETFDDYWRSPQTQRAKVRIQQTEVSGEGHLTSHDKIPRNRHNAARTPIDTDDRTERRGRIGRCKKRNAFLIKVSPTRMSCSMHHAYRLETGRFSRIKAERGDSYGTTCMGSGTSTAPYLSFSLEHRTNGRGTHIEHRKIWDKF